MSDYFPNQPPSYPPQNPEGHPSFPFPAANPQGTPAYPPSNPQGYQQGTSPYPQQDLSSGSFPSASSFPSSYYSSYQQQTPPQPKSKARVILIVAAILMFAAGGVFGALYIAAESDHDKAASTLEDKKAELAGVKKAISSTEDDKTAAEQQNGDLQTKVTDLTPCVEATQHFLYDNLTDAESQAAIDAMLDKCT